MCEQHKYAGARFWLKQYSLLEAKQVTEDATILHKALSTQQVQHQTPEALIQSIVSHGFQQLIITANGVGVRPIKTYGLVVLFHARTNYQLAGFLRLQYSPRAVEVKSLQIAGHLPSSEQQDCCQTLLAAVKDFGCIADKKIDLRGGIISRVDSSGLSSPIWSGQTLQHGTIGDSHMQALGYAPYVPSIRVNQASSHIDHYRTTDLVNIHILIADLDL